MQESHFIEKNEKTINNEFDGKMFHSYGNTQSKGVSIYVKNNLKCKTINEIKDTEGRIILINIEINENIFTLINVYAPNQHKNRNKFFKKVQNIIENNRLGILILGGDMNETLSINDKKTLIISHETTNQ